MWCKYCVYTVPVETIPGIEGEENKGEWWRG
jgi:hypothetical protein